MTYEIDEIYAEKRDMTFLMLTEKDDDDQIIKEDVVGWYHGNPRNEVINEIRG